MKAYKCDRCGKLFEHYEGQGTDDFYNVTSNPNFKTSLLDLCPKCIEELQRWVVNANTTVVGIDDKKEQENE